MRLHQYSWAMSWSSYLLYTSTVMHRYRLPTFVSTLRGFVTVPLIELAQLYSVHYDFFCNSLYYTAPLLGYRLRL